MSEKSKHAQPGYLEVILIALVVAIGVAWGYDRMFAQKIAVVDLKGYVRTQQALVKSGDISSSELKARFDALGRFLDKEAARNPHRVIILKDVVLKNGEEIHVK